MSTTTQRRTADDWADFIEAMDGKPPSDDLDAASRALLAVAYCERGWAPACVLSLGPQGAWQLLSREQWAGLVRWTQQPVRQVIH